MRKGASFSGRILDAFDLEADRGQRLDDRRAVGIGLEMLLQPGQGELHAPTPPLKASARRAREKP